MNTYVYQKKLVSLITPGWNGRSFVHRLFDSIIAQTYRPIQYIYIDDCSTDGTLNIVEEYKEKFEKAGIDFVLIKKSENGGLCESVMTGLQTVQGEFFSCPEYDDVLLPESVSKRVEYLQSHVDCAVVTADAWVVGETDLLQRTSLISRKNINRFDRNHFFESCLSRSVYNAACIMIRTEMFDKTHVDRKFFSSRMAANQQVLLPLYYHWNRGWIDEPLSIFVIRSNSVSHSNQDTLKHKLDRLEEYHKIFFNTLDSIEMLKEDRKLYKHQIDINFQKDYIMLGFEYHDKSLFESSYNFLLKEGELSDEHKIWHNSRLRYSFWELKKKMSGGVIYHLKVFVYKMLHGCA